AERPGRQRPGPRGEYQGPTGLGGPAALGAGGRGADGLVRQRRAPALAGGRQVQAGGGYGRGGGFPDRARSLRLLAALAFHDHVNSASSRDTWSRRFAAFG